LDAVEVYIASRRLLVRAFFSENSGGAVGRVEVLRLAMGACKCTDVTHSNILNENLLY
jgi:hypothetical protein